MQSAKAWRFLTILAALVIVFQFGAFLYITQRARDPLTHVGGSTTSNTSSFVSESLANTELYRNHDYQFELRYPSTYAEYGKAHLWGLEPTILFSMSDPSSRLDENYLNWSGFVVGIDRNVRKVSLADYVEDVTRKWEVDCRTELKSAGGDVCLNGVELRPIAINGLQAFDSMNWRDWNDQPTPARQLFIQLTPDGRDDPSAPILIIAPFRNDQDFNIILNTIKFAARTTGAV